MTCKGNKPEAQSTSSLYAKHYQEAQYRLNHSNAALEGIVFDVKGLCLMIADAFYAKARVRCLMPTVAEDAE